MAADDNLNSAMIDGVALPVTQCRVLIDGVTCPVPYGLTIVDGVRVRIPFEASVETIEQYPSVVGSLTYTGSAQSPQWSDYDESKMTIGGETSGTNAGSYTTTFTPVDGYSWPDGTTDAISVTWSIAKAAGSVTLSKTSVSVAAGSSTKFTVSRSGDGAISVKSSNTGVAKVALSGTTVTVTGVAGGSAIITVSVGEGTNHLATSKTCSASVTVTKYTVTIEYGGGDAYQEYYPDSASFTIAGETYTAPGLGNITGRKVSVTVDEGTEWSSYTATGGINGTYMNGRKVAEGKYTGKVTSDMKVRVQNYGQDMYFVVDITTS